MRINQRIEGNTHTKSDGSKRKVKEKSLPPPNKDIANKIFDLLWQRSPILSLTSQMSALTGLRYSDTSWLRYEDFYDDSDNFVDQFTLCQQKTYNMRLARMKNCTQDLKADAFRKSSITIYTSHEMQDIVEETRSFTDGGGYLFSNPRSRKVINNQTIYRPMSVSSADHHHKIVKQQLEEQGIIIKGLATHSWRKFFALMLDEAGTPIKHIRDLLGHSSILITDKYLHSFKNALQKDVRKISLR